MSFKVKGPKEDADTKRQREQAEARAESSRTDSTKRDLDRLTEDLLRAFGRRSALGGLAGGAPTADASGGGTGAGFGGGTGEGGSFDPGFLFDPLDEGEFSLGREFGRNYDRYA